jgi:hypothetical protein
MVSGVLGSLASGSQLVARPAQSVNKPYLMLPITATLHAQYHTLLPHLQLLLISIFRPQASNYFRINTSEHRLHSIV